MKRIAYFGGTFDPVHNGHLAVARGLIVQFRLDRFVFLPAFHAPHKPDRPPTSSYHRYAMLALATAEDPLISISTLELDKREKRYTIDTLAELEASHPFDVVFFVMGADSWEEIRTWRDWENVLLSANHIVVSRPGHSLNTDHVTRPVAERIVRFESGSAVGLDIAQGNEKRIYLTDLVRSDTSASEIREDLSDGRLHRTADVPAAVAKYIEKYELYTDGRNAGTFS